MPIVNPYADAAVISIFLWINLGAPAQFGSRRRRIAPAGR